MLTASPAIGGLRPRIGGLAPQRAGRIVVCAVTALISMVSCASASAALNLTGTWSANYHCEAGGCAGANYPATDTLTQTEGPEVATVTGTNGTESITGTLTGNTFQYHSSVGAYKAEGTLTVSTDGLSWSGSVHDTNGTSGTYTATRNGASSGALSQLPSPFTCVSVPSGEGGDAGCGTVIPFGLSISYENQVSPDGRNVYAVGFNNALVEFSRSEATGALSEIGCVTGATTSCSPANATLSAKGMENPAALAPSPDGKNVYVVTQGGNAVVTFERDPVTGLLAEAGCISQEASTCGGTETPGLNNPYGVAVSPDGANVYVAAHGEQAVSEFARNPSTGALTQLEGSNNCLSSEAGSKCGTVAVGLEHTFGVTVSPDGKSLYVAGGGTEAEGDIAEFARNTSSGGLTQLLSPNACLSTAVVTGCTHTTDINGSEDILVSPDGSNVYANSVQDNAVVEFARSSATGALTPLATPNACISSLTTPPSDCTSATGIGKALGVAISPDGSDVYVDGAESNAIGAFTRDPATGALTQFATPNECITENPSGCATNKAAGLSGARRLTVSPDGTNVYVSGQGSASVAELARALMPTVSSVSPSSGPEAGGTTVTITGGGFIAGASVSFGASPASSVTVNSASSITATSPAGSGTVHLKVTTSSGTSAATSNDQFTYAPPAVASIATVSPGPLVTPIGSLAPLVVPPPVLARSGNVAPVSGKVLVRLPGSSKFVALSSLRQIPFGSVIEAINGVVSVTTALPGGRTQTGEFFKGEFILRQGPNGLVVAELAGGNFSVCPTARERSHVARVGSALARVAAASRSHVVRKLWANAHGKFSTKGNYAAGAVQGTEWLTEDLCDGTLIKVTRDKVAVTNLVTHRHKTVKAGHSYLAKAP